MATFSGNEPVTTLSDNFSFLNNQINDSGAGFTSYAVDTGTANNLIVTLPSAPVAYEAGMMVCTTPAFSSTGASVINVNSLGNVSITNAAGISLVNGGELSANAVVSLVYDGTKFRIIGPCALSVSGSAASGTQSVNCAGYSSVTVSKTVTGAGTAAINLQNLSRGVHFVITLSNASGGPQNYGIQSLALANSFYTLIAATGTIVSGDFNSAFLSVANGQSLRVWGSSGNATQMFMNGILG